MFNLQIGVSIRLEGDLCFPIYGGKQTSVLRNACEVLKKKKNIS